MGAIFLLLLEFVKPFCKAQPNLIDNEIGKLLIFEQQWCYHSVYIDFVVKIKFSLYSFLQITLDWNREEGLNGEG